MTYERLLLLPLFQGMTMADMHDAVATTKFLFKKYSAGKVVAKENDALTSLCLLLDGTLMVKTKAHDGSYSLTERLLAPNILQPERLFGFTQKLSRHAPHAILFSWARMTCCGSSRNRKSSGSTFST